MQLNVTLKKVATAIIFSHIIYYLKRKVFFTWLYCFYLEP